MTRAAFLLIAVFALTGAAPAETVSATVVRVIDGDTLEVSVAAWPAVFRPWKVRIYGIDTPETVKGKGRAKCDVEKVRGKFTTRWVRSLLPPGSTVSLQSMGKPDKYGRLLMRVFLADGTNLGRDLLANRLASDYSGGRKAFDWCRLGR